MVARVRRSHQNYIETAAKYSSIAPRLKKFKGRKRLKPHEKAYISRVENAIGQIGVSRETSASYLLPADDLAWPHVPHDARITHIARLKHSHVIHAIYRPHFIAMPAVLTFGLRPDPKYLRPQLTTKDAAARRWIFVPVRDRSRLEAVAITLFKRHKGKRVLIYVWVARGTSQWNWSATWTAQDDAGKGRVESDVKREFGKIGAGYSNSKFRDENDFDPIIGLIYHIAATKKKS